MTRNSVMPPFKCDELSREAIWAVLPCTSRVITATTCATRAMPRRYWGTAVTGSGPCLGDCCRTTLAMGISKVAAFLTGDSPKVLAYGFTSPLLRSIGETEIIDELRVILHDEGVTAYFTFS